MLMSYLTMEADKGRGGSFEYLLMNSSLGFVCMLGVWLASRRNLKFIELCGSGLAGSGCIAITLCDYAGLVWMEDDRY